MARAHRGAVTFSAGGGDARAGVALADLLACGRTGALFAAWAGGRVLDRAAGPGGSARTFYCPVCPGSALRVHGPGAREAASCAVCGWGASAAGIDGAAALLAREGDPWPAVSARIAELAQQHAAPAAPAAPRRASFTRPPPPRSLVQCIAAEEAKDAALRGLLAQCASREALPSPEIDPAPVRAAHLLPLSAPVLAHGVSRRAQVAPRRRLRGARLMLAAPGAPADAPRARPAAEFMPTVEVARLEHDCAECDAPQTVGVEFTVRNGQAVETRVVFEAEGDGGSTVGEVSVPPGESRSVSLNMEPMHVASLDSKTCPKRLQLGMNVRFSIPEDAAQNSDIDPFWDCDWQCTLFVAHSRATLKEAGKTKL